MGFSKDDEIKYGGRKKYEDKILEEAENPGYLRSFCSTACNTIDRDNQEDYAEIENLKIPTCVIWGDADKVVDYNNINVLKKLIPSAEYFTLKDTGHAYIHTRAKETSEIIDKFIKTH